VRDLIIRRFASSSLPPDPVGLAQGDLDAHVLRTWYRLPLRPAAVLVPLVEREAGLTVLFTVRRDDLPDHPGEIAFPGGRPADSDTDLRATALREAHEEIGLAAAQVDVVGSLHPQAVISGYAVVPVVGFVPGNFEPVLQAREVAQVFEVPLDYLLEPESGQPRVRIREGVRLPMWEYTWREFRIWGATAQMLHSFIKILK
jgi:8-oxo-dGTP pyrophosphatase MutT (NUDIX family)